MLSNDKFIDEFLKDFPAPNEEQATEGETGDKDTYTRAEVDALIMEKIKEFKEGLNNGSNEESNEKGNGGESNGESNGDE